jgi:hypothetical protein
MNKIELRCFFHREREAKIARFSTWYNCLG